MRPQPPGGSGPQHDSNTEELRNAEWYFGKITREEAKVILSGKPDGSFLVRDALSTEGEYTLTLIKDGTEKLIKICHLNGMYGFVDCKFHSVVDLVNFYRVNSLKLYNKMLDITLSNPMVRPVEDDDLQVNSGDLRNLAEQFLATHQTLGKQQYLLEQKLKVFKSIEMELNEKKQHQDVFMKAEKMFQSQIKLLETFISTAGQTQTGNAATAGVNGTPASFQEEHQQLQANAALLKSRLSALCTEMQKLNRYVDERKEEYKRLERQINAAKPELQKMTASKEKFAERLMEAGISEDDMKHLTELGYEAWHQRYESLTNQPHNIERLWFLRDLTRQEAEELLRGTPTGTFLIRARSVGHYALSIVCKNTINHCIIYETESGFGFAAPYNIYVSLKQLVLHYSNNSLEEHNDTLTTTLRYPVLYWHEDKDTIQKEEAEELMRMQYQMPQENTLQEDSQPSRDAIPTPGEDAQTMEVYGSTSSVATTATGTTALADSSTSTSLSSSYSGSRQYMPQ